MSALSWQFVVFSRSWAQLFSFDNVFNWVMGVLIKMVYVIVDPARNMTQDTLKVIPIIIAKFPHGLFMCDLPAEFEVWNCVWFVQCFILSVVYGPRTLLSYFTLKIVHFIKLCFLCSWTHFLGVSKTLWSQTNTLAAYPLQSFKILCVIGDDWNVLIGFTHQCYGGRFLFYFGHFMSHAHVLLIIVKCQTEIQFWLHYALC